MAKGKIQIANGADRAHKAASRGDSEGKPSITAREMNERLLDYGARVIKLVEALPRNLAGRRIGDQLLRSSIAIGAHYEEAQAGESREDFVHKLQLALKELRESNYWLRLLVRAEALPAKRLTKILDESNQLKSILSKAVATTKRRAGQGSR